MNELLDNILPSILENNNYPMNKKYIIYYLNNGRYNIIVNNSILTKLINFYDKLKRYYNGKIYTIKIDWKTTKKIILKDKNIIKQLYKLCNSSNNYFGYVISTCYDFLNTLHKYNYNRYNRGFNNICYLNRYKLSQKEIDDIKNKKRSLREIEDTKKEYEHIYVTKEVSTTDLLLDIYKLSLWLNSKTDLINMSPYDDKDNYLYLRYHNDINRDKSRVEMEIFIDWYSNPEDNVSPFQNLPNKKINKIITKKLEERKLDEDENVLIDDNKIEFNDTFFENLYSDISENDTKEFFNKLEIEERGVIFEDTVRTIFKKVEESSDTNKIIVIGTKNVVNVR